MNSRKSPNAPAPPTPPIDVIQDDADYGPAGAVGYPLQVLVKNPILYTQELPAVHSVDGNFNVPIGQAQPMFDANPLRKELTFWAETNPIFFGRDSGMVTSGRSAHLPSGGSVVIRHKDPVYMRGDGGTALVSFIQEHYGD
jgi:hypothetical protein